MIQGAPHDTQHSHINNSLPKSKLLIITQTEDNGKMGRKTGIEGLDTPDRVRVLGIIDQFRDLGVNEDISLP